VVGPNGKGRKAGPEKKIGRTDRLYRRVQTFITLIVVPGGQTVDNAALAYLGGKGATLALHGYFGRQERGRLLSARSSPNSLCGLSPSRGLLPLRSGRESYGTACTTGMTQNHNNNKKKLAPKLQEPQERLCRRCSAGVVGHRDRRRRS